MYCKNCGKEIDDDSKFCQYCGVEQSKKETGTYTEPKVNNTPKHKTCSICGQTNETVQDYHVSGATHTADGSIGKLLDGGIYLCSACAKECPKCEGIIITPQIKQLLEEFKNDWNADEVDISDSCECDKNK